MKETRYRNKNALREFELLEKYEAGIVLSGAEVKSVKTRGVQMDASYVRIIQDELYLINAGIAPYQPHQLTSQRTDSQRTHPGSSSEGNSGEQSSRNQNRGNQNLAGSLGSGAIADTHRSRKLLLHKKEILKLQNKLSQKANLTIVPISCYNKRGKIKVEIALARGRKGWEKKKIQAGKDEKRRVEKEMKEYLKKKA